jgi:hypothetical protein
MLDEAYIFGAHGIFIRFSLNNRFVAPHSCSTCHSAALATPSSPPPPHSLSEAQHPWRHLPSHLLQQLYYCHHQPVGAQLPCRARRANSAVAGRAGGYDGESFAAAPAAGSGGEV